MHNYSVLTAGAQKTLVDKHKRQKPQLLYLAGFGGYIHEDEHTTLGGGVNHI